MLDNSSGDDRGDIGPPLSGQSAGKLHSGFAPQILLRIRLKIRQVMQRRLNPFTVNPDGVAALIGVEKYLQASGLDHKLITLVNMRVSQMNGCAYCLHMHSEEARKIGESDVRLHLLDAWHESSLYSARERAALAWAESLTNIAATHAPDAVYDEARRYFSEKELADLSISIAMINVKALPARSWQQKGGIPYVKLVTK